MLLEDFNFDVVQKETKHLFPAENWLSPEYRRRRLPLEKQLETALEFILSHFFRKHKLAIQNAILDEYTFFAKITQEKLNRLGLVPVGVKRNIEALNQMLRSSEQLYYISLDIVEKENELGKWKLLVSVTADEEHLSELRNGVLT
jgi:hypothetical protein